MIALEKLLNKNNENKFICVGLDTDLEKIPEVIKSSKNPIYDFNKAIIEATKDYAASYKLNFAFYESEGLEGLKALEETLSLIPVDILTIGDAKRGDIGNTSSMYAKAIFDKLNFDAITLHPYMGFDSLSPFIEYQDKLNFILALTSNPGANDFEKLKLSSGEYLYQTVIAEVNKWNKYINCGIVFGATKLDELKENIKRFLDLPVLLPGVGAQGGSLEDVVSTFKQAGRKNYLVNISRGIIYKSSSNDFAEKAHEEIIFLNKKVEDILLS
ncbi:MAG: orotidine-5'-phosphate decarboxylase [Syntrophothermus sp.]